MVTELTNLSSATLDTSLEDAQASGFTPVDSMGSSYGFESINLGTPSSSLQALAAGPNLEIITPNLDVETSLVKNRMVFSTVNEERRPEKTLKLSNTGNAPLTITLNLGQSQEQANAVPGRLADHQRAADFIIGNTPVGTPFTLGPGDVRNVSIAFRPQRNAVVTETGITDTLNGENYASLTINSNDPDQETATVHLAGLNAANYEGVREPSIAEIARTFGYSVDVGSEHLLGGSKTLLGDEVYSPYWVRVDASKPVELWQLAVYSSRRETPHDAISFAAKGSTGNGTLLYVLPGGSDVSGGENQRLLPEIMTRSSSSTSQVQTSSTVDFSPTTPFSINQAGTWVDDSRNGPNQTHNFRLYPVRDIDGVIIPDNWLVASDAGSNQNKNFDNQDQVYLLKNARPEKASLNPSRGGLVPGSDDLIYNFNQDYSGTLKDKNGQTTGFTSVQLNENDGYTATSSYRSSLLDIDPNGSVLRVTTSATAGTNGSDDNTLVNGLQTSFDSRASRAMITTTLLGSLSYLNAGVEQAGVMFGPNDDNYIKLVARALPTGGMGLEFYKEVKGVGDRMGELIPIANPGSLQSLELMLLTDPEAGTVRAAYRIGDSPVVQLSSFVKLKGTEYGRFLAAQSQAGIIASSKGGTSFTATFDRFGIFSNETTPPPNAVHRLDVGGSSYTEGPGSENPGRFWSTDAGMGFFTPTNAPSETGAGSQADIRKTENDQLYRTYRARLPGVGPTAEDRVLSYSLPVGSTPGTYHVRLHFAEIFFGVPGGNLDGGVGSRVFDVAVENERTIRNFDITAAAGDAMTAVVLPFENVQVNDGILNIRLKADVNFGAISGIEVLQKA